MPTVPRISTSIAGALQNDYERPVVNQVETSSSASAKWLVAYQTRTLFTPWDVVLRKVSTSGSLSLAISLTRRKGEVYAPTATP